MSRSGEREQRNHRRGEDDEQELATKTLQVQSKRFYFDIKENKRGRFVTVAEVEVGGRKNRIIISMSTLPDLCDHLKEFIDFPVLTDRSNNNARDNTRDNARDGNIKSSVIVKDNRRYYLDLKENQRGRFLRISMATLVSQQRSQIAIPASGMKDFHSTVNEIIQEFKTTDVDGDHLKMEPQAMRAENKMFYFDVGENRMGTYLRISEVRTNFRAAIAIPEHSWCRFRDVFAKFVDASTREGSPK